MHFAIFSPNNEMFISMILRYVDAIAEEDPTMATVRHKSYISMGRNFNNILKYNVLSSNFCGYLKLLRVI